MSEFHNALHPLHALTLCYRLYVKTHIKTAESEIGIVTLNLHYHVLVNIINYLYSLLIKKLYNIFAVSS